MNTVFHQLIKINALKKYNQFKNNFHHLRKVQLDKIGGDYNRFSSQHPLTTYENYQANFLELKNKGKRVIPTSGSTNSIKWIPYNKNFSRELDNAIMPWLYDLYLQYPLISKGKHFWSMSWLPENLRSTHVSDDLEQFGFFERMIMKQTMVLDKRISTLPTLEDSLLNSLQLLIEEEVSLISVWSPTFLLEMLNLMITHKSQLISLMKDEGKIKFIKSVNYINEDVTLKLFPSLVLISAWDTSTSAFYAKKIKTLFPHVHFQGKGLFATEGVVTIPFENEFHLSYLSHFYEFQLLETNKVIPAYELESGMKAKVILTAANGLTRYQLNDVVEVVRINQGVPVLTFLGRDKEIDLVGEKLNHKVFIDLIDYAKSQFKLEIFNFYGILTPEPRYQMVIQCNSNDISVDLKNNIIESIENKLQENFHYRLARETKQLAKLEACLTEDPLQLYLSKIQDNIQIRGNIKIEPVIVIKE